MNVFVPWSQVFIKLKGNHK